MDASQLFGTLIRILNQPVFPPRARRAHAAKARAVQARPHLGAAPLPASAVATQPAPLAVPTGPAPIMVSATPTVAARAPATTQAMRTLEEVRADLARLREQAKRRQAASAQARHDQAFAPTDFMDFGMPAKAARPAATAPAFAPTDFMDDLGGFKTS